MQSSEYGAAATRSSVPAGTPAVQLVEVAPRDGLQNEPRPVDTAEKIALIERLAAAGSTRIEAVGFAHPKAVPQLADAEAVVAALPRGTVSWSALVLNERGLDRALSAGVDEINVVVVVTDTFSRRNQNTDVAGALAAWERIAPAARAAGLRITVTLAAAFGCPFEGEVAAHRLAPIVARCAEVGPDELAFADTIGVGVPAQVRELAALADVHAPGVVLRWHFHNTRNTGYANALAACAAGARRGQPTVLDAAAGGIGGCPFAPGATGNIATADLLWLLRREGWLADTEGPDLAALSELDGWLGEVLGRPVPGQLGRAGSFPPAR